MAEIECLSNYEWRALGFAGEAEITKSVRKVGDFVWRWCRGEVKRWEVSAVSRLTKDMMCARCHEGCLTVPLLFCFF